MEPLSATEADDALDNVSSRLHGPLQQFMTRYFGDYRYDRRNNTLECRGQPGGTPIALDPDLGASLEPGEFLGWLLRGSVSEQACTERTWSLFTPQDEAADAQAGDFAGEAASLVLTAATPQVSGQTTPAWDNVRAVGQFHRRAGATYQDGLGRLCQAAHQVFASQPTRPFLHAFYMRGPLVEFWAFDRRGAYCGPVLDIGRELDAFLSAILSYYYMPDDDLGTPGLIKSDHLGSYIVLSQEGMPDKLYLEGQPCASRRALVGNGTACYKAKASGCADWQYVVKFKWRWARKRPENELLKLTQERRALGAISLNYYAELETTANLRRGLRWGPYRELVRPSEARNTDRVEAGPRAGSGGTTGLADHTEEIREFFQNWVFTCVVTSPVGRPLSTFRSLAELLRVFRDAIRCHRSLFFDARLLHQDISHGNVLIMDTPDGSTEPRGVIIDLDSAIEIATNDGDAGEEEDNGEYSITGTRPFMAIGVLQGTRHTYRHDLESFLYLFLWAVITNHADNPPEGSRLKQWSNADYGELAARKSSDMGQDGCFQRILREFPSEFDCLKPLAEDLRQTLFPLRDGVVWIGTDASPESANELYGRMIELFEVSMSVD